MKTLWFRTWHQAVHFAHVWELDQAPEKRVAWVNLEWREEWSLLVPEDWKIPLLNN